MIGRVLSCAGRAGIAALAVGIRVGVLLFGGALLLSLCFRPSGAFVEAERPRPRSVGVSDDAPRGQYVTRMAEGDITSSLALLDPTGKRVLTATYNSITGMTYVFVGPDGLKACNWVRRDGALGFCVNSQRDRFELSLRDDGRGGLRVTDHSGPGWAPGMPPPAPSEVAGQDGRPDPSGRVGD